MAAKKKKGKTTAKKPGSAKAKKAVKKASKPAKKAAKKAPRKAKAAGKPAPKKDTKTRAQALKEARKKVPRKGKTPRISKHSVATELSQKVINAYANASREMAEWLAAARRSDKTG